MPGARANFRRSPAVVRFALRRLIAQRRRRDERAVRRLEHLRRKRHRRIDRVAIKADVAIFTVEPLDTQPVDVTDRRRIAQRIERRDPARQLNL